MRTLITLLALMTSSYGTVNLACKINIDPCCQDCRERAQLCDWRHQSLTQESQCFNHESQCLIRCQSHNTAEMRPKAPPAGSNPQLSSSGAPNPAKAPTDSGE